MGDTRTTNGRVLVWLRPVQATTDTALLDGVEQARFATILDEDTKRAYAAGHGLARAALSEVVGVHPERLAFDRTCGACGAQHGRPVLTTDPTVSVSLSRTDAWVAVAVSRDGPVGVDVEGITRTGFSGFPDVALHPSERRAIEHDVGGGAIEGRLRQRATAWVRKEAALKAVGLGLALDPASMMTPPSGIRTVVGEARDAVTVLDLTTGDHGVAGAVALVGDHDRVTVEYR